MVLRYGSDDVQHVMTAALRVYARPTAMHLDLLFLRATASQPSRYAYP